MAARPIIFALANPDPEIGYRVALETRPDALVATGRSDFPNQVNNVLGFPYIFRGALDVRRAHHHRGDEGRCRRSHRRARARGRAGQVLRAYGRQRMRFGRDYLIPKPFDQRVLYWVAPAVAQAAMDSGVAREQIDVDEYRERLFARISPTRRVLWNITEIARKRDRSASSTPRGRTTTSCAPLTA